MDRVLCYSFLNCLTGNLNKSMTPAKIEQANSPASLTDCKPWPEHTDATGSTITVDCWPQQTNIYKIIQIWLYISRDILHASFKDLDSYPRSWAWIQCVPASIHNDWQMIEKSNEHPKWSSDHVQFKTRGFCWPQKQKFRLAQMIKIGTAFFIKAFSDNIFQPLC